MSNQIFKVILVDMAASPDVVIKSYMMSEEEVFGLGSIGYQGDVYVFQLIDKHFGQVIFSKLNKITKLD